MNARPRRGRALRTGLALALLTAGLADGAAAAGLSQAVARRRLGPAERVRTPRLLPSPAPRATPLTRDAPGQTAPNEPQPPAFLIYLLDGGEPIVVTRYREEGGHIVFQKYGGWIRIPTFEILKIVPDQPDRYANLPAPALQAQTGGAPLAPEPDLYLTMRGGGNLRVASLKPEGDRVRVAVANGSFTVARSEILGVVRMAPNSDAPEAWLSIRATEGAEGLETRPSGPVPPAPAPRLPSQSSDRPHFLRLQSGQLMRVEGFWVEEGEFRFRRLGGIVGIALNEVARLFPEEIAPVRGRTPVRFARRLAPDLLEVRVRSGYHRVRLAGVEPAGGTWTGEDPWAPLERGLIVYLEFDRQRYDAEGNWLAYVFLPNGRMLNAELVRFGLARLRADGWNVRYLDLLHEMSDAGAPAPGTEAAPSD